MANVAIVGAGQSGLLLAFGLLRDGHRVTLVSDRTSEQILNGRIPSGMGIFENAIARETELGLCFWEDVMTCGEGAEIEIADSDGALALRIVHPAPRAHRGVDQRLKNSRWMDEFERRGGEVRVAPVESGEDLDRAVADADLAIVAVGKAGVSRLFERDAEKSPLDKPQRHIIGLHLKNFRSDVRSGIIHLVPGVGEFVDTPFYNRDGTRGRFLLVEGIPGGPLDQFAPNVTGAELLDACKLVIPALMRGRMDDLVGAELISEQCWLRGALTPGVRRPVARLPSGRAVLGLGDTLMVHDPLAAQGGNNATLMADFYRRSIAARAGDAFDAAWMQSTFDDFWQAYGRYAMGVSNGLLMPPAPFQRAIMVAASAVPSVAAALIDGLYDPVTMFPWFVDAGAAAGFLRERVSDAALLADIEKIAAAG